MKNFEKLFQKLTGRHTPMQVFDDFLTCSVAALGFGSLEDMYLKAIKDYDSDEQVLISQLFGAMVEEYSRTNLADGSWNDMLGDFFMDHVSRSSAKYKGQFFTPVSLCDLMAKMTFEELEGENLTAMDPCCGSGRTLIAHCRVNAHNRMKYHYVGVDIDRLCVMMTVINFVLNGMSGTVIWADSLRMEVYGGYRVYLAETGLGVKRLPADVARQMLVTTKVKEHIETISPEMPAPPVVFTKQLNLFENLTE